MFEEQEDIYMAKINFFKILLDFKEGSSTFFIRETGQQHARTHIDLLSPSHGL